MKTPLNPIVPGLLAAVLLPWVASGQVNSGSNGSDGAFNPAQSVVIDMADHPDGIYQYTSVNIPAGVTVTFVPNARNKPVVWLVQGGCVIAGTISVPGESAEDAIGRAGGPGGFYGGSGGTNASAGQGPGGGPIGGYAPNASYGALATTGMPPGVVYGNQFLIPLVGGSGGGGSAQGPAGGGGGGGAILIAAQEIQLNGLIGAAGGSGLYIWNGGIAGGAGSGGAVRLICNRLTGTGSIDVSGGYGGRSEIGYRGGSGRIRFDTFESHFGGSITGVLTQGFQPIILPVSGQGLQLAIQSVGGVAVPANPSGVLANPDVIVPAQQTNPVSIVVSCTNVPLNTQITVVVQPANGAALQAVGINSAGSLASSTATVSLNIPRGGGTIYAKAVTGIAGSLSDIGGAKAKTRSLAETGWTADGERFVATEIQASLGGKQSIIYLTESGKRYPID